MISLQLIDAPSNRFSKLPRNRVPGHGVSYLLGHDEPEPRPALNYEVIACVEMDH
ncbi:hypothetical protein CGLAU_12280 [Corynebacterium glaucum]|uniref:Uncharacterized protein n=1 Tax=Corynebacterium glaucum TaxID=187491 RepID=A0A1Q2HZX0_9CORY|nr:hypothetical protein CGLAU_12280 [Corynebacterium glaucum]